MFKKKYFLLVITLLIIFFIFYFNINNKNYFGLRSIFKNSQIQTIKKYLFPYKLISQNEMEILKFEKLIDKIPFSQFETEFKKSLINVSLEDDKIIKLPNNLILKKKKIINGFYAGIHNIYPGSGYFDFHKDNFFILSARGILAYSNNLEEKKYFNQIKNNIDNFINLDQFKKNRWFSIKDLLIFNDKIYISYTEEIEKDCWNTSIIYGEIDYDEIYFKKLFSGRNCIHSKNNLDNEFNAHQSGGRIVHFDKNHLLLTVGDYRNRFLGQKMNNINGKIIKINIVDGNYKIVSIGHRNPQGIYYDKNSNLIIETEHGPFGGDEINLIETDKFNSINPQNFGWPIVSAGEHYGGNIKDNKVKYEKYPLYKSHSKYGFIEPLKSFVPSIGISEIDKIGKNKYVVSSLKDKSIYFFELDKNLEIFNIERIDIFERIRDLKYKNNKLYLFLEDSPSIGIIDLN